MKKEDFKYDINDKYVFDNQEYLIIIKKDIFDEETIEYASRIAEKYEKKKDNILEHLLNIGLSDFYNSMHNYSNEYIKSHIGRPQININSRKDDAHPNWKFKYAGIIDFCEHKLDEHIISIEFIDDLNLDKEIQING